MQMTERQMDDSYNFVLVPFERKKYAKIMNCSNQNPNPALRTKTGLHYLNKSVTSRGNDVELNLHGCTCT